MNSNEAKPGEAADVMPVNDLQDSAAVAILEERAQAIPMDAAALAGATFAPPPAERMELIASVAELIMLPIARITPSPSNVRGKIDNAELIESVRRRGILQPLLVRPSGLGYEVVAGHRRLAAAKALGFEAVPALVRSMDDSEALQAQLTENLQRTDLAPMDEAHGYGRLHRDFHLGVDDIALRVAKSRGYVYGRMKLLDLCPEGVAALTAGKLSASTALLIARIPDAKLQARATAEITSGNGEPLSHRAALLHLQENYTLRLADAPFQTKDDLLVMGAGSCTKCPKRSGNNPDLFGDLERADVCTDPICYRSKVDANWASEKERARERGWDVMPVADSRRLYASGSLGPTAAWVDVDAPCQQDKQRATWKKLWGKELPTLTLAMDTRGGVHALAPRSAASSLLKELGMKGGEEEKASTAEEREAQRAEEQIRQEVVQRIMSDMVLTVQQAKTLDEPTLRLMVMGLLQLDAAEAVLEHRGWDGEREAQRQVEKKLDLAGLRGLLFELATASYLGLGEHFYADELKAACRVFGLDLKGTEKQVRADQDEMQAQEAEARAKVKVIEVNESDPYDPIPPPRKAKAGKRARA